MYKYEIANTVNEVSAALDLVSRIYVAAGYFKAGETNSFGHHVNGTNSRTMTAHVHSKLFATISLVLDGQQGVPMDQLYKEELDGLRTRGRIAEMTQYAVDHTVLESAISSTNPITRMTASLPLLKLALNEALSHQVEYVCIAINPKHVSFYDRLGFQKIGELKVYPSVNNAPAEAYALTLKDIQAGGALPELLEIA
jgi:hypothetical protein